MPRVGGPSENKQQSVGLSPAGQGKVIGFYVVVKVWSHTTTLLRDVWGFAQLIERIADRKDQLSGGICSISAGGGRSLMKPHARIGLFSEQLPSHVSTPP